MGVGKQVAEAYIEVNGDLGPFRRDLERARLAAARAANQMEAHNDKTWKSMSASARRANKAIEKDSDSMWRRVGRGAQRALGKVQKSWSRMDSTVRLVIGLIAAAGDQMATLGSGLAAGGTALISTFGMALANLIPLVATLPGLAYGIGLAVSSIKGMVKEGGKAADAIKGIGKAYRETAVPAFTKEWEDSVISFSKTLTEKLSDTSIPKALGQAFAGITDSFTSVLKSPSFAAFEKAMSTTLADAIKNIGVGIANITRGFMELFAAAGPAAVRLTNSFRQWGDSWANTMSRMRQDGTLQRVFDTAYTSGAALVNLGGALGRAMGSVFMIGAKYGDDLANSLAAVTNKFTAWSQTAAGQQAINEWFANGVRIIKAMEPLVVGVAKGLDNLVTEKSIKQWEGLNQTMGHAMFMLSEVLRVIGSLDLLGSVAALFDGLVESIAVMSVPLDKIATVIGGTLRSAIDGISRAMIGMGIAMIDPLNAAVPGIEALGRILTSTFAPMADILVSVFRLFTTALTPAIQVVSAGLMSMEAPIKAVVTLFDDGLRNIVTGLQPIFESFGRILGGVAVAFGNLVIALLPTIGLLGSMFTNAIANALPVIGKIVESIANFLVPILFQMGEGFRLITPLITAFAGDFANTIGTIIGIVGGMFTAILPTLTLMGHAFASMLPSIIVVADVIGKALMTAISSLAPVLVGLLPLIGGLIADFVMFAAGVAPIVANLFANIVNAVIPLIPIITTLVAQIVGLAATFISQLLPAVLPIIEQFGTVFTGILLTLMPYITQFVATISQLAIMFITQLLPALMPIIATLGAGLLTIMQNLAPVILTVVTVVGDLVAMFLAQLLPALMPLMAAISSLVQVLVAMLVPAFQILGAIIQAVMPIIQVIIEGVINNVIGIIHGLTNVIQGIADFFNAIFKGDIAGAWNALWKIISGAVEAIWNFVQLTFIGKLLGGLKAGMTAIIGFFKSGWSNVVSGVSSAWSGIISFISNAMGNILRFIGSGMAAVGNFFRSGWSAITSFVSGAWSNLINGAASGIGRVMSFVGGLPGKIGSALGGLPGQLLGIARNMMQGFINGVVGMAGNIFNAAVNAVKGAIDGVKNFLGIRSPSRLMKTFGGYTGEGFAIGLDELRGRVASSAQKMAEAAVGPFDRSTMFIAGKDAGAGLAQGLTASKAEIGSALSGMSKKMTVSAAAIGSGTIGSATSTGYPAAPAPTAGLTIAEGAIQIVTPTKDPGIVASKVVDELTNYSLM